MTNTTIKKCYMVSNEWKRVPLDFLYTNGICNWSYRQYQHPTHKRITLAQNKDMLGDNWIIGICESQDGRYFSSPNHALATIENEA